MRRSLDRASDLIKAIDADFVFHPHLTRKTAATAVHGRHGDQKTAGFLSHADLNSPQHYVQEALPEADFDVVPALDDLLPLLAKPRRGSCCCRLVPETSRTNVPSFCPPDPFERKEKPRKPMSFRGFRSG